MGLETKQNEKREADAIATVDKMNESHARLGMALSSIAGGEFNKFVEVRKNTSDPLSVSDITNLYRAGQYGERLAKGQAISRSEMMIELIGTFVREFVLIFLGVNEIEDAVERKSEYIRRCDEMLHEVYPPSKGRNIKLIKSGGS